VSTKSSIKHRWDPEKKTGYHLYRDLTDLEPLVHLELNGVEFDASTDWGGGTVRVAIPREWAIELGLVTPVSESSR
jgi:hypothetical protein